MAKSGNNRGRLIFGGSFNPIHVGHLRLAIEAFALMKNYCSQVDFVPTAFPPHKKNAGLLPFAFRAKLVRAALSFGQNFYCNEIENSLPVPSYSEQTLKALLKRLPDEKLFFLLGSHDFTLLPEWRNGLSLPTLCDLVIAPRKEMNFADFLALCEKLWPQKIVAAGQSENLAASGAGKVWQVSLKTGGRIFFLQIPFLDISATYIRKLWLLDENVDFLMPFDVLDLLEKNRSEVTGCWRSR